MSNLTTIIPVKIDSEQRRKNISLSIRYLLKHTDCKIIVTECDDTPKLDISKYDKNRLSYIFEKIENNFFHRTRLINQMLDVVDTPIVANYDADVFLPPSTYEIAQKLILSKQADVVYPYGFNAIDQRRIFPDTNGIDIFEKTLNIYDLHLDARSNWLTRYGHVQFFSTDCYRAGFMENENYKHWCPEDDERGYRFKELGYKVIWCPGFLVYHQEHPQSTQPMPDNLSEIHRLHNYLMAGNKEAIENYYKNQEYLQKYNSYKKLCIV